MGADSLKANLSNPARPYLWEVIIPAPIGTGDTTLFQVRAQSSEIPGKDFGAIEIPYKQTAGVIVAGKLKYDHTWSCTFIEGEDKKVFDAIYSWQQNIVDNVTGIGVGDPLYKTDVYINSIKTSGDTFMKIKMKGAWIKTVGKVALSYADENKIVTYDVTFEFDSWEDAS